jgi:prophage regulatory protein
MGQIIMNKAQLLEELGVVENTLRALIESRGFPPPRKMGAKLFWLVAEVLDWLRACPSAWGNGLGHDTKGASDSEP